MKNHKLTRQENVFLAKRYIVDVIHSGAKIENLNVTFPQTQTIIDNGKIYGIDTETVSKVVNLHNAWKYVLSHLDEAVDLKFICKINGFVAYGESLDWGHLRNGTVGVTIDGTRSIRKERIPATYESEIIAKLANVLKISDPKERAAEFLVYAIPEQLFWDGNKRTSFIVANKILIDAGAGLVVIPEDRMEHFAKTLSAIYLDKGADDFKKFIIEECITLKDFSREQA